MAYTGWRINDFTTRGYSTSHSFLTGHIPVGAGGCNAGQPAAGWLQEAQAWTLGYSLAESYGGNHHLDGWQRAPPSDGPERKTQGEAQLARVSLAARQALQSVAPSRGRHHHSTECTLSLTVVP
jgi:hypothetical protein